MNKQERSVIEQVQGFNTIDGAGVHLVRVLGGGTVDKYNPILMLDSFDSDNPADYTAGFPMHPHRGIETISYVYYGKMMHRDSMGHEDTIADGEVQWMTAGSGIMHEELVPEAPKMLGVQLWLNLPKKDKWQNLLTIVLKIMTSRTSRCQMAWVNFVCLLANTMAIWVSKGNICRLITTISTSNKRATYSSIHRLINPL